MQSFTSSFFHNIEQLHNQCNQSINTIKSILISMHVQNDVGLIEIISSSVVIAAVGIQWCHVPKFRRNTVNYYLSDFEVFIWEEVSLLSSSTEEQWICEPPVSVYLVESIHNLGLLPLFCFAEPLMVNKRHFRDMASHFSPDKILWVYKI